MHEFCSYCWFKLSVFMTSASRSTLMLSRFWIENLFLRIWYEAGQFMRRLIEVSSEIQASFPYVCTFKTGIFDHVGSKNVDLGPHVKDMSACWTSTDVFNATTSNKAPFSSFSRFQCLYWPLSEWWGTFIPCRFSFKIWKISVVMIWCSSIILAYDWLLIIGVFTQAEEKKRQYPTPMRLPTQ